MQTLRLIPKNGVVVKKFLSSFMLPSVNKTAKDDRKFRYYAFWDNSGCVCGVLIKYKIGNNM